LDHLGIQINTALNQERSDKVRLISTDTSPVKILVTPTNEELEIAQQTFSKL
jgi:acetate kinase